MSAVSDVYTYLQTQGIAGGSTQWGLIRRRLMDTPEPNQMVMLVEDGGPPPEISITGDGQEVAVKDLGVLVTVRAKQWDGDASLTKAQEILTALHGKVATALVTRVYIRISALTAEPVFAGFDEQGRPLHTVAFRLLTDA